MPSGPLPPDAVPRVEPRSRYGNPSTYEVFGQRYAVMESAKGYRERGIASWYGRKFHGRKTSSGERYDMHAMTAAHRALPLPTYVEVTNLENGRVVIVRVNDRGPFHSNRIIDLSYSAARKLDIIAKGTGLVEVRAIDPATFRKSALPPRPVPTNNQAVPIPVSTMPVSAPPQAAPPVQLRPATPPPKIFLQAGAFAQEANAQKLKARLLSVVDVPVQVELLPSTTLTMHRVRLGPLASVPNADRIARSIADAGMSLPQIVID